MQKTFLIYLLLFFITTALFGQQRFSQYFEKYGVTGSTTVYDYKNKIWTFTDSADAAVETLPASTFKILNSLIALQTKVLSDENEIIKWDGTPHQLFGKPYPIWDKDMNLKNAYKNSAIWFYVRVAEKVGRKQYKKLLRQICYGNADLTEKGTDFWNYGKFAISPKNQIAFLVNLYEDNLPFSEHNLRIVKDMMVSEKDDIGTFRDKTGWTKKDGEDIGWWTGYVTTNDNVYFFATRIMQNSNVDNSEFAGARKIITKEILKSIVLK
jgi:beta-lactamase class D